MDLLRALESQEEEARRRIKSRYELSQMYKAGFPKPRFGTSAYQQYLQKGWISPEEAEADAIKKEIRALRTGQQKVAGSWHTMRQMRPPVRSPRFYSEPPIPSSQYAPATATTALRDNRLTPQAKALLMIIHARCAKDGFTKTTKGTLASIMSRSERSIGRYLSELSILGYIASQTRKNARGLYVGLRLSVTNQVKPFFDDLKKCGTWLANQIKPSDLPYPASSPSNRDYSDRTQMSYKNQILFNNIKGNASGIP